MYLGIETFLYISSASCFPGYCDLHSRVYCCVASAAAVMRAVLSKNSDGITSRTDFTLAALGCTLQPFVAVNGWRR
jgi:hypothetical protein